MDLPLNCTVEYIEAFLSKHDSEELYSTLIREYKIDQSRLIIEAGGKRTVTDSFKILFSTDELIRTNSHPQEIHGKVFPWVGPMAKLKQNVESRCERSFDLAMCLYYPDGSYFAPYHFDQETSGVQTILPSISLGEVRAFSFKENISGVEYSLNLASGSLLIMGAYCQARYTHSLPKDPRYKKPRINITFREPAFS